MPGETQKQIEKPWAVYGWFMGSWNIGKIVQERKNSLDIQYVEGQRYPPECWDPKWVHRFDNPVKAMAYFRVHQNSDYSKREVINLFLNNFPSETANFEKLIAPSQPKCTEQKSSEGHAFYGKDLESMRDAQKD